MAVLGTILAFLGSIAILLAIIVSHEAGHFVMALLTGIKVKSLHLGFPKGPQLKLHLGKYPFTISLALIGAMVDVDEDQLWEAPFLTRLLVFLGGPLANFIALFAVSFLLYGWDGGLAYGWKVITFTAVSPFLVLFGYVSPKEIMGPVGIVSVSTQILSLGLGLQAAAHLFAVISGALGTFNLLPIPAMDGGRVMMAFFADRGLSKKRSKRIIYGSLIVLIILMAAITAKDLAALT